MSETFEKIKKVINTLKCVNADDMVEKEDDILYDKEICNIIDNLHNKIHVKKEKIKKYIEDKYKMSPKGYIKDVAYTILPYLYISDDTINVGDTKVYNLGDDNIYIKSDNPYYDLIFDDDFLKCMTYLDIDREGDKDYNLDNFDVIIDIIFEQIDRF